MARRESILLQSPPVDDRIYFEGVCVLWPDNTETSLLLILIDKSLISSCKIGIVCQSVTVGYSLFVWKCSVKFDSYGNNMWRGVIEPWSWSHVFRLQI